MGLISEAVAHNRRIDERLLASLSQVEIEITATRIDELTVS